MRNTLSGTNSRSIGLSLLVVVSMVVGAAALFAAPAAAAGDVSIEVDNSSGADVDNASVTLYKSADDSEVVNGTADSTGNITFSSVADGNYYAVADEDGYFEQQSVGFEVNGSAVSKTVTLDSYPSEHSNHTVAFGNDTETLWAEIEADNTTDVAVEYYGVQNGTETLLERHEVTASSGEVTVDDLVVTDQQTTDYEEAKIVIKANDADINSTDFGKTVSVSGGGGSSSDGLLGYEIYGFPAVGIVLVALAGAYVYTKD
jgi:hypothetical protein